MSDTKIRTGRQVIVDENLDLQGFEAVNAKTGTTPNSLVTKSYVDTLAYTGLKIKDSCRAATTLNYDLNGAESGVGVDGVDLNDGDRVLVRAQADPIENGIYIYNSVGAWARAEDFDEIGAESGNEVTANVFTFVEEGDLYADTGWVVSTDEPVVIGVSDINWVQYSSAGTIQANVGLEQIGNLLNVKYDNATIGINGSNQIYVKNDGIGSAQIANGAVGTSELADDSVTAEKINSDIAGAGLVRESGNGPLAVNTDGSTLEVNADVVRVKDLGITTAKINDDAVTKEKIAADVAGNGLGQNGNGSLEVNVDGTTIQIAGDTLSVGADSIGAAQINETIAGAGLVRESGDGGLAVNSDESTLTVLNDIVKVKNGGITATQLNSSVAGNGIAGGGGSALSIDFVRYLLGPSPLTPPSNGQTVVTLADTPMSNSERVYLNGQLLTPGVGLDYTITTNVVTLSSGLKNLGINIDTLQVVYYK